MKLKTSLLFCALLLVTLASFAQPDTTQPAYKRFPHVPAFKLLRGDSTTWYTKDSLPKNKAVFIMLFSPECSHCQHTAEDLVKHKDDLKDVQIVMATLHSITQMNAFYETYGLKALPNVVLGKDVSFILPSFYKIRNLPYMAFYNKAGDLIKTEEGSLPMDRVIEIFKAAAK